MKHIYYLLLISCLVCVSSCKKKDKTDTEIVVEPTTLTIDSSFAIPGDPLKIKLNKKVTQQEVSISISTVQVKAYAASDSEYVFFMPSVAPGKVSITIPSIKNSNSLSLTVRDYTAISDPQTVITEFVSKRNSCIDSVTKVIPGVNYQISPQTLIIINQLKQEWDEQLAKIQGNDKLQLAYILKKIMLQPTDFSLGLRRSAKPLAKGLGITDVGENLMALARRYVTLKIACLVQIPIIAGSLAFTLFAPNPFAAVILAGSIVSFILLREAVIQKAQQVGSLPGIVEGITDAQVYRALATEFYNNTEKAIGMDVQYRNLKTTDQNIHPDISNAFQAESEMLTKDQEVEKMYTKATQYTSKLKEPYEQYDPSIGKLPLITNIVSTEGEKIIVKGVSDNRINYSTSLTAGTKMIKISSTSTQEIPFTINVAYKRALDGFEFKKDISCVFKPQIDSIELFKASIVGNWRIDSYDPNGVLYYVQHKTLMIDGSVYIRINKPVGEPEVVFNPPKYQERWDVVKDNSGYHLKIEWNVYPYVLKLPVTFINGGFPPYPLYVYTKE